MNRQEALKLLPKNGGFSTIPLTALPFLRGSDLPPEVCLTVIYEENGEMFSVWDGALFRQDGCVNAFCSIAEPRSKWTNYLGLPFYFDILRRSIETRQRLHGDVEFHQWNEDDESIWLEFTILNLPDCLADAADQALSRLYALEEEARLASEEVGKVGARIAERASGWGAEPLEQLVLDVEKAATANEKGRSLEQLVALLFEGVPGFSISGRRRMITATEEIDISILNSSDDPVLKREEAYILVECKNWSSACGRPEFTLLRGKVENRKDRCSLAFLISWNGFAETVDREMLRGSRERLLIVPISGEQIKNAVRKGEFELLISNAIEKAIHL